MCVWWDTAKTTSYLKRRVLWEWNCRQSLTKFDKWSVNQQSGLSNAAFREPVLRLLCVLLPVRLSVISSGFSRTELISLALGPVHLWGWLVLVLQVRC